MSAFQSDVHLSACANDHHEYVSTQLNHAVECIFALDKKQIECKSINNLLKCVTMPGWLKLYTNACTLQFVPLQFIDNNAKQNSPVRMWCVSTLYFELVDCTHLYIYKPF